MLVFEGFLSQHMAAHIAAMNLLAPLVAWLLSTRLPHPPAHGGIPLLAATLLQVTLLWGWHHPSVMAATVARPAYVAAMHVSLFLAGLWFWRIVIDEVRRRNWTPVAALLVTGKLVCLLGLLLAFAPRPLYAEAGLIRLCFGAAGPSLADQQLAGLVMLAACPVVYVGIAIVATRRWLSRIDRDGGWSPRAEAV